MVQSTHTNSHYAPLTCIDLSASQRGVFLYKRLSFSLCEGAVLVISGANGAGKTTLLKQLAGLSSLQGCGHISWFDNKIKDCRSYEQDMLYIGDNNALYPDLRVSEQLQYIASVWGETERLDATIKYLQLLPYLDQPIRTLSAGWKRRVSLSRLLLIPSLLWLLDEPAVHLDKDGAMLLGGIIHSHAEKGGITIIAMPETEQPPSLHNVPVSVLKLSDFNTMEHEDA